MNVSKEQIREGLRNQLKELASLGNMESAEARQEFAAAITVPILQLVRDQSVARQLFAVEPLGPGAQAAYPVADDFEAPVFTLPTIGRVQENYIEAVGEEVYVPTFKIGTAFDWSLDYARDGRIDIAERAMRNAARAVIDYEEEAAWRLIVAGATTGFAGKGLLAPRPAPITQIGTGPAAGFYSKELLNQMIVKMKRAKRVLTDVYVSPEDMADVREWGESEVDPVTRREIFVAGGRSEIFGVAHHEIHQLGQVGKYNINAAAAGSGIFRLDGAGDFNDYTPTNAVVTDADGNLVTEGETQIYGMDLTVNDSLVMPIRQELKFWDDPNLHRNQKQGFYGWEILGMGLLDSRMLSMGVIDRSQI